MDLLGLLNGGLSAVNRAKSAQLEGAGIKREREQADLLAQIESQRKAQADAQRTEAHELNKRNILDRIRERGEAPAVTPETFGNPFEAEQDGQRVFVERGNRGTTRTLQGYTPPQKPAPAPQGPVRGTPAYLQMLKDEAKARGGDGDGQQTLPAPAIEKMIVLDNVIGQATRAKRATDEARAAGENYSGRVGGMIPVPAWARNAVRQGGEKGISARNMLGDLFSQVGNMRSGGAISPQEFDRLTAFLPDANDDEAIVSQKLTDFIAALNDMKRVRIQNYQQYGRGGSGAGETIAVDDGATVTTSTGRTFQRQPE